MRKRYNKRAGILKLAGLFIIIFCFFTAVFCGQAWAGGLYINEFATPSLGTAGAGAQAWADNASTSFFNPAGMTRLDGKELMLGGGLI